jgi:hypothetical protein
MKKKINYDIMGEVEWVSNLIDDQFNGGLMTDESGKLAEKIVRGLLTKNYNGWVIHCQDGYFRAESSPPPKNLKKFAKRCKVIF